MPKKTPEKNSKKLFKKDNFSEATFRKEVSKILDSIGEDLDNFDGTYPEALESLWPQIQSELAKKMFAKNWRVWSTMWTDVIGPEFVSSAQKAALSAGVKYTGEIGSFAKKYHRDHGLELCKTLTETDVERIRDKLIDNWGVGEKQFEKLFEDDYLGGEARLKTIYRSEHARATSEGTLQVGTEVGHSYKKWYCAEDERTCEVCYSHHNNVVPMDSYFEGGYAIPQDCHPSCRCVLITLEEDDLDDDDKAYLASHEFESLDNMDPTYERSPWKNNEAFRQVLNYKCPEGSHGPGFGCGGEGPDSVESDIKNTHIDTIAKDNQKDWEENFPYGDNDPYPTEKSPRIIENYEYFEGSDEQFNGDFENPEAVDITFDYDKTTQAKVFYHSNVLIVESGDPDVRSMNRLSTGDVTKIIDMMPNRLIQKVGTITINPFENIEDERAIASAEQNSIIIYGNKSKDDMDNVREELPYILAHEAAHIFDGEGTERISTSDIWKFAIEKDLDKGSISTYAGMNQDKPQEDFAEAVAIFVTNKDQLKEISPTRYAVLNKIFNDNNIHINQKLNSNCKEEDKIGKGPGSCGGSKEGSNPKEPRWKTSAYIMNSIDVQLDIHLPDKTAAMIMRQGTKFNPNMREELNYTGSGIGLTKRIDMVPNVWYNKVEHEKNANDEGIYTEALHEIGHSLTYSYGDDLKKLDIWKNNSPKSLHEDLKKAGIENMKGLTIDLSDEDEAFADLFKSYISPRTNLKLKAAAPAVYAKMEIMFGKSDYDIDLPEPVMKLFKTLAIKGWNLKSTDLKELGITEKQSKEIADLIEPPHAKGQTFIASTEWGNYSQRMQKIKEMFVKPSDALVLRHNSEKVMGETNKNLMTKGGGIV